MPGVEEGKEHDEMMSQHHVVNIVKLRVAQSPLVHL